MSLCDAIDIEKLNYITFNFEISFMPCYATIFFPLRFAYCVLVQKANAKKKSSKRDREREKKKLKLKSIKLQLMYDVKKENYILIKRNNFNVSVSA